MAAGLQDRANLRVLPDRERALEAQKLRVSQDAIQRRAQLMRHHGDKAGFRLVGLFRRVFGGAQFNLGRPTDGSLLFQGLIGRREVAQRVGKLPPQLHLADRLRHRAQQAAGVDPVFHQVVLHAALHRLDRDDIVSLPGDQHHGARQLTVNRRRAQEIQPVYPRQVEIHQHAIKRARAQGFQASLPIQGFMEMKGCRPRLTQQFPIKPLIGHIVVDDQDLVSPH